MFLLLVFIVEVSQFVTSDMILQNFQNLIDKIYVCFLERIAVVEDV